MKTITLQKNLHSTDPGPLFELLNTSRCMQFNKWTCKHAQILCYAIQSLIITMAAMLININRPRLSPCSD